MRFRIAFQATVILCILLCGAQAARADSAPLGPAMPRFGQGVLPQVETRVVMTAEEVVLEIYPDRTEVKAVFHLTNSGPDEELRVGFPRNGSMGEFRVREGETELQVSKVTIDPRMLPAGPMRKTLYKDWFSWDMRFPEKQEKTISVTYRFSPQTSKFGFVPEADEVGSVSASWNGNEEAQIEKKLTEYWTGYVLETGAGWSGPIGKAVLEARFHDMNSGNMRDFRPRAGSRILEDRVIWEFRDLEPTSDNDLFIAYNPTLTLDAEIAEFERLSRPGICGDNEYWWRIWRLVGLYEKKGNRDDRIEELMAEMIDRIWPKGEIHAPLRVGERQVACLVRAIEKTFLSYAARKKDKEICALAARTLRFLDVVGSGRSFTVYHNGYRRNWDASDVIPKRAAKLAAAMKKKIEEINAGGKDDRK